MSKGEKVDTSKILLAFLAVYLIWGSTYLAIKFALESFPPFLMGAIRFTCAGAIMYVYSRCKGVANPGRAELIATGILGFLFLVVGSGGIVLAEKTVSSGLASLIFAIVPVYIVLIEWLRPGGTPPTRQVVLGLLLGVTGLVVLLGPSKIAGGNLDLFGVLSVLTAALGSASGAVYSRHARLPAAVEMTIALEMLFAGLMMFGLSASTGEFVQLAHRHLTWAALGGLLYLMIFGSIIAFSACTWLFSVAHPSRVTTYTYVNPVVAVFLGWLLADEQITMQTVAGASIILSAVWLINQAPRAAVKTDEIEKVRARQETT